MDIQLEPPFQAIILRSVDGTELLSLSNVRLDGHPFILLADVRVRTYNCSWDDQTLVFDRHHTDGLVPLAKKLARGDAGKVWIQLRDDMDNLAFELDSAGRANATGELTFSHGWEGFGFEVDRKELANFVRRLARAVESAE